VGVGCSQIILALSERQLAQTEWLGTIRSLSGAVGILRRRNSSETLTAVSSHEGRLTPSVSASLNRCMQR